MTAIVNLIDLVLELYLFVVIAYVVFSWLFAFNIVNPRNQIVASVYEICWKLTDPVLSRIRAFLPSMGGIDLSPIVLFFGIYLIRGFLRTGIY